MAVVPKGKKIVNDTTPMICTIEGIAKKEHVVRSKLVFTVLSVRTCTFVRDAKCNAPNRYKRLMLFARLCRRIISWKCNEESTMTTLGRLVSAAYDVHMICIWCAGLNLHNRDNKWKFALKTHCSRAGVIGFWSLILNHPNPGLL